MWEDFISDVSFAKRLDFVSKSSRYRSTGSMNESHIPEAILMNEAGRVNTNAEPRKAQI